MELKVSGSSKCILCCTLRTQGILLGALDGDNNKEHKDTS